MTLLEKVGQMTQADIKALREDAVRDFGLGSVLSGGGGNPAPNNPRAWADMVRRVISESLQSRLGIPILYGVDAVHGHSNVRGATIFPHNIGLGAARDPDLMARVADITARELLATNVRWTFAPTVSVPQDIRWGRTYEGFGQSPELVASLGAAYVRGLTRQSVLASPKHFVGDGGTEWGTTGSSDWVEGMWKSEVHSRWRIDQGDLRVGEAELRATHLLPYREAIGAGAMSVMVSYSSWNGEKLHAHRYLITDVLKGEMGFEGFVVSDWLGVTQLDANFEHAVCLAINAGIDMVMVPFEYARFIRAVQQGVESGVISMSRVDDACRRILAVKEALGLFESPFGNESLLADVGAPAHRAVAREAVSRSQVLLKNEGWTLPLPPGIKRILVAGEAADDIGLQCGGWTIEWQGERGATTAGTTLLKAIDEAASQHTSIVYRPDGDFAERGDAGIVVVGERPYAEGEGDTDDLSLTPAHVDLIRRVRSRCDTLVLVIYSGRPLIITDVIDMCDAVVASWLPGTEAGGIADVLFGSEPFSGLLPHDWPRTMSRVTDGIPEEPLFPFSFGLRTNQSHLDRTDQAFLTSPGETEDVAAGS